jgi:broad specificity phosphatase PhoE
MRLYLVRHGESEANKNRLFSLPTVPLTDQGIKDAESVGRVLSGTKFDRVLVSPYTRARQTLEHAMPGVVGEIVDELHEYDCGCLEGNTREEMEKKYPDLSESTRVDNYTRFGGECYDDVRARARSLMDYVASLGADRVVAFSHAGFILTFLDEVMGREGKEGRRVICRNGSVNVFEYRDGIWHVLALGITEQL